MHTLGAGWLSLTKSGNAIKNHISSSLYSTASHCLAPPKFIKNRKIKIRFISIRFISKYFNNHTIGNVMCEILSMGLMKNLRVMFFSIASS
ncbi:hypothetical protein BGP_0442 [Beggiatoa sp. PS]|nr:hypothetical protein BGP_0442 [Beggiatoa sp. PS]